MSKKPIILHLWFLQQSFWDIMPCTLAEIFRRFGGTYHLHLQGRGVGRAKKSMNVYLTTWSHIPKYKILRLSVR
jgi:hypothetical protein